MSIRALLFDLDNTLIDRDAAMAEWLATLVPAEHVAPLVTLDHGSYSPRPAFYSALGAAAGLPAGEARERFAQEMPTLVRLRPDAAELLARTTLPIIIVTNGLSQMQRTKVVAAGLEGRVQGVIVSEEVGSEKPSPGIFRAALRLVGCTAQEAIMIGDHPINDIAGARSAGIEAVFVRSRWFEPPVGVRAIDKLTELAW